jgi:hypothetical protein
MCLGQGQHTSPGREGTKRTVVSYLSAGASAVLRRAGVAYASQAALPARHDCAVSKGRPTQLCSSHCSSSPGRSVCCFEHFYSCIILIDLAADALPQQHVVLPAHALRACLPFLGAAVVSFQKGNILKGGWSDCLRHVVLRSSKSCFSKESNQTVGFQQQLQSNIHVLAQCMDAPQHVQGTGNKNIYRQAINSMPS